MGLMFGLIYCAYGLGFWYGNKLIQDHRWGLMLFVDCKEIFLSREEPEYLPCVTECFHLNDTNSGLRNSAMRWIFRIFFLDWNISLALGGCHFFHSKSSPLLGILPLTLIYETSILTCSHPACNANMCVPDPDSYDPDCCDMDLDCIMACDRCLHNGGKCAQTHPGSLLAPL